MEASTQLSRSQTPQALLYFKDVPDKGRGVFASCAFGIGDEVLEFRGRKRAVETFKDLTHALQIAPRRFLAASGGIDDFVNHSCEPNCGVRDIGGRIVLFALAPIGVDDEISFDYATTQTGGFFVFNCQCGAHRCRGNVGDFHDMPAERQAFYIQQKALLSYLLTITA